MSESQASSQSNRLLHHRRPTLRTRFIQPVVVKQGGLFLLCTDIGDILRDSEQGLFFHDMRYLSQQELRINGMPPVSLLADASEGNHALFELTNPDIEDEGHKVTIPKEALGIRREKHLGNEFTETIVVTNYLPEPVDLVLNLSYEADFADMFVVRGMPPGKRGTFHGPSWHGRTLRFQYDGADDHERRTSLRFTPEPDEHAGARLTYRLRLQGREQWKLQIACDLRDTRGGALETRPHEADGSRSEDRQRARQGSLGKDVQAVTDNRLFDRVLTRCLLDLHMLRMRQKDQAFFAAGVPWYVALFGRDSLVTALQVVAFEPEIAANTLRVLAQYQGTKVDDWRDEQPGKIPHELRVDEMANLAEIPQTPYYGSVDSTPKFLILLGVHAAWTGSLDLLHELSGNVDRALAWIAKYGDSDGDGFVDYITRSSQGARNQGWKDSGNGIVMADGTLAEPPIALPEVQGDVYLAWTSMAELFERDGDTERAHDLRSRAGRLRAAFNDAFWLDNEQFYAMCRQADGQFSHSISSNGAHGLWTGIAEPEHAWAVADRVLQPDMFSGWGVRTLSSEDRSYNPVDYQVGSVWPHDNAFIVAGLQRYGCNHQANEIFTAIFHAATRFEQYRLPELFAGYQKGEASRPVGYPVACNPQAWAAGSVPFMLTTMLGLRPEAFERRLRVVFPALPDWLGMVKIQGLRVGDACVDLEYRRLDEQTLVAVTSKEGQLDVIVEPG